jgi:hypothetical protein
MVRARSRCHISWLGRVRRADFPASPPVTLQPGQSYAYQGSRVLAAGSYTGWPAYYDGAGWHELAAHTAFTDS